MVPRKSIKGTQKFLASALRLEDQILSLVLVFNPHVCARPAWINLDQLLLNEIEMLHARNVQFGSGEVLKQICLDSLLRPMHRHRP